MNPVADKELLIIKKNMEQKIITQNNYILRS